jgi:hypothetical protein
MSLLVRSLALIELLGMGRARAAWTDVVGVGVVRRPILRKIAMFSQGLSHLRLDPVCTPTYGVLNPIGRIETSDREELLDDGRARLEAKTILGVTFPLGGGSWLGHTLSSRKGCLPG